MDGPEGVARAAGVRDGSDRVRAAIVQAEVPITLSAGLVQASELTRTAARDGATLVVFPEAWLPGYPIWLDVCRDAALWDHAPVKTVFRRLAEESVAVPGPAASTLAGIARENRVTLVMGVSERVDAGPGQGTLYNSILIFGPDGALLNHHRKLMPTYTERMVWGAGDAEGLRAVGVPNGERASRVGALVCWEHWMPLARQALHESGEDIHVALWPTVHEMHQVASRQYAFEGRCFVLAAGSLMRASALPAELEPHPGKVTSPDQWIMRGGSAIIGPDGSYIADPVYETHAILVTDLDLGRVREERMTLDVTGTTAGRSCSSCGSRERAGVRWISRRMGDTSVRLVAYDPLWPMMFEAEAARIEEACAGLALRLEHIGSTAVPGMSAKPVIDILAGRPPRSQPASYIAAIRQLGYEHKGAFGVPGREYFRRGTPRSHHVHLVSWSSAVWQDHLRFRDLLRADAAIARDYEALKRQLAIANADDRRAYTDGKGPFIRAVLRGGR